MWLWVVVLGEGLNRKRKVTQNDVAHLYSLIRILTGHMLDCQIAKGTKFLMWATKTDQTCWFESSLGTNVRSLGSFIHHPVSCSSWTSMLCNILSLGWLGEAKVLCILSQWGVQPILAYSWARPAILAAGKSRGGMFLFLLFLHFHSFSFLPCPSLSSPLLSLLPFSGSQHKMTHKGWRVVKSNSVNQYIVCHCCVHTFTLLQCTISRTL